MIYFTIDGDDIGNKITHAYISNDATLLSDISIMLKNTTEMITELLLKNGFTIIFSAADGVAAFVDDHDLDIYSIFGKISEKLPKNLTYSAGAGACLKDAYIALIDAKSSGKNKLVFLK